MHISEQAQLLRVIVGESDRLDGVPLHEAIVLRARELGLAGATAVRACLGYGASSRLHSTRLLRLSIDLPVVIEILDRPERIATILPFPDASLHGGLVTLEDLRVLHYGGAPPAADG